MKSIFSALVLALFLSACTGRSASGPSSDDCEQLRDHVVDLQLAGLSARATDDERLETEVAKHHKNLVAALGDEHIDECKATRSETYIECALEASTKSDLADCE
jgi:hypothetical protein